MPADFDPWHSITPKQGLGLPSCDHGSNFQDGGKANSLMLQETVTPKAKLRMEHDQTHWA